MLGKMADTGTRRDDRFDGNTIFEAPFSSISSVSRQNKEQLGRTSLDSCISLTQESTMKTNHQRKRSYNIKKTVNLSSNSAINEERQIPTPSNAKWSKDELLQHYSQCMKLSQQNKINHKNAFDLQLIEYMGEMIKQDGPLNFRVAGGTIFAGAKIYASRVDAIHSEIYRVLNSLGHDERDDSRLDEETFNEDEDEKITKKRKKYSKIFMKNESTLRLPMITCFCPMEAADRLNRSVMNAESCDSFMFNRAHLCNREAMILFEPNISSPLPHVLNSDGTNENSETDSIVASSFQTIFSRLLPVGSNFYSHSVCDVMKDFDFSQNTFEDHVSDSENLLKNITNSPDPPHSVQGINDLSTPVEISDPDILFNNDEIENEVFEAQAETNDYLPQKDSVELTDALAHPPGEYSYFNTNALSVVDTPSHWLRRKRQAADNSSSVDSKKRILSDPLSIEDFSNRLLNKKLKPKKQAKPKQRASRTNLNKQILVESSDFTDEILFSAMKVKLVLQKLCPEMLKQAGVTMWDKAEIPGFSSPTESEDCLAENVDCDYDSGRRSSEVFTPKKEVGKIPITFAKRAKRINVKSVKTSMWSIISDEIFCKHVQGSGKNEDVGETLLGKLCETGDRIEEQDRSKCSSNFCEFSEMYRKLPSILSQSQSENLSAPLVFTCLLHLATEKQLKIEGMSTLSDVKIFQDLS